MDTTEAADIAMTRLDRPHETVAFEAAALRGLFDRLHTKGRELALHITTTVDGTDPLAMSQAAGALAVLEMLDHYLTTSLANTDDVLNAYLDELS